MPENAKPRGLLAAVLIMASAVGAIAAVLLVLTEPLRDGQEHSLLVVLVAVAAAVVAMLIIDVLGAGIVEIVLRPVIHVVPQALRSKLNQKIGGPLLLTAILLALVALFVALMSTSGP